MRSINDVITDLQTLRSELPDKDPRLSRVDRVLIPLWQQQRMNPDVIGPLDPPPHQSDILLSDIGISCLHKNLSTALQCKYLSPSETPFVWPIQGIIYGDNMRLMLTIPVSWRNKCLNVHFLIDTGSPSTHVAADVISQLGMEQWQLGSEYVKINGIAHKVAISDTDERFRGLNLLGMDYLYHAHASLTLNCADMTCVLFK